MIDPNTDEWNYQNINQPIACLLLRDGFFQVLLSYAMKPLYSKHISINYPGSTSDFLAFESSSIRPLLEQSDFLAPSLCIFGDNAYVNRSYMATPYPNVGSGSKDSYNFYHSQLRINIECAFGILVQRWGIIQ